MACRCSDAQRCNGLQVASVVVNEAQRAHVSNTVASCAALALDVFFPSDAPPNSSWRGRYTAAKAACLLASVLDR